MLVYFWRELTSGKSLMNDKCVLLPGSLSLPLESVQFALGYCHLAMDLRQYFFRKSYIIPVPFRQI